MLLEPELFESLGLVLSQVAEFLEMQLLFGPQELFNDPCSVVLSIGIHQHVLMFQLVALKALLGITQVLLTLLKLLLNTLYDDGLISHIAH